MLRHHPGSVGLVEKRGDAEPSSGLGGVGREVGTHRPSWVGKGGTTGQLHHHLGWMGLAEKWGDALRKVLLEWAEAWPAGQRRQRASLTGREVSQEGPQPWKLSGGCDSTVPRHSISFTWFTGREQASRPECLPAWTPQPAAAGVPGSGAAASPLPAGLGLLCHLYLQHL